MILRSGTRQRCPLPILLFNAVLMVLARTVRPERKVKEEVNSLFLDDVILYPDNLKESIPKEPIRDHEFSNVQAIRSIYKNLLFISMY